MQKIILLHGALGAKSELIGLATKLSENFEVYNFEFDGHGITPETNGFGISVFAESLKKFIQDNALQNAGIFGYSMGGYVALYLASDYHLFIGKIITLGTKFNWTPESAELESKKLNPDKIEEKVPKFAQYLQSLHGEEYWKTQMLKTAQMMRDLGAEELLKNRLDKVENRCFLMRGSLDEMVTEAETIEVCGLLKNASYHELENTMHPITKVNLDLLSEKIRWAMNEL